MHVSITFRLSRRMRSFRGRQLEIRDVSRQVLYNHEGAATQSIALYYNPESNPEIGRGTNPGEVFIPLNSIEEMEVT